MCISIFLQNDSIIAGSKSKSVGQINYFHLYRINQSLQTLIMMYSIGTRNKFKSGDKLHVNIFKE